MSGGGPWLHGPCEARSQPPPGRSRQQAAGSGPSTGSASAPCAAPHGVARAQRNFDPPRLLAAAHKRRDVLGAAQQAGLARQAHADGAHQARLARACRRMVWGPSGWRAGGAQQQHVAIGVPPTATRAAAHHWGPAQGSAWGPARSQRACTSAGRGPTGLEEGVAWTRMQDGCSRRAGKCCCGGGGGGRTMKFLTSTRSTLPRGYDLRRGRGQQASGRLQASERENATRPRKRQLTRPAAAASRACRRHSQAPAWPPPSARAGRCPHFKLCGRLGSYQRCPGWLQSGPGMCTGRSQRLRRL